MIKPNLDPTSEFIKKTTKVLLVCVFNKNSTIITHDIFYNIFSNYGEVQKVILIFERSRIWKAFIEMLDENQAENAMNKLNETSVLDDGSQMNVYFSNLEILNFDNSNTCGIDYCLLKRKLTNMRSLYNINFDMKPKPQPSLKGKQNSKTLPEKVMYSSNHVVKNEINECLPELNDDKEINLEIDDIYYNRSKANDTLLQNSILQMSQTSQSTLHNSNLSHSQSHTTSNSKNLKTDLQESLMKLDNILCKKTLLQSQNLKDLSENSTFDAFEMINSRILEKKEINLNSMINFKEKFNEEEKNEIPRKNISKVKPPLNLGSSDFISIRKQIPQIFNFNFENKSKTENYNTLSESMSFGTHIGVNDSNMKNTLIYAHNQLFDPEILAEIDPSTYINPLFIIENRKSKVIYCRNLDDDHVSLKMLYNVFSNFGDICKLIFLKKKKCCLIEYESINYASYAKEYMNNMPFFGNSLKIFFSNYTEIVMKEENSKLNEEIFIGTPETYRIKNNKNISINPPSEVIHLSNLKKEACSHDIILNIFSPYGKIEAIKFIFMEHFKNMCLIRYSSIEESLKAVAYMHKALICGRKIQISFTRSQI